MQKVYQKTKCLSLKSIEKSLRKKKNNNLNLI